MLSLIHLLMTESCFSDIMNATEMITVVTSECCESVMIGLQSF